jgi:hypothetical protein
LYARFKENKNGKTQQYYKQNRKKRNTTLFCKRHYLPRQTMDWLGELYKGAHHNILPVADDHCKDKSSQNHPHQKRQGIVYKLKDYYFHVFEG